MRFAWVGSRRQTAVFSTPSCTRSSDGSAGSRDSGWWATAARACPSGPARCPESPSGRRACARSCWEVVADLVLLFQLVFLALFEFHLQLQKRLLGVGKRLGYLGRLPSQVFPIAVLAIQVERDALADALQHPRRVLDVPLDDDKIVPDHRVLVLVQGCICDCRSFWTASGISRDRRFSS